MFQLQVPFKTNSAIELAATALLRQYERESGVKIEPPVPIDDIVEKHLGLTIEVVDLRRLLGVPDVLGATYFHDKIVRIEESLEGKEGRFAFTLGHECGHWVLHRPVVEAQRATLPLFAVETVAPPPPPVVCRAGQQQERAEVQANQFAAALLAPADWVRAAVRELHGERVPTWAGLHERRKRGELDEQLRSLAASVIAQGGFTNFSNEAMRHRLVELKLVADAAETGSLLHRGG